jgi:hypothetical protein
MAHDFSEKRMRHACRCTAASVSREVSIQVATIRKVAGTAIEALDVDDRNADDRAVQFFDVDVIEHAAHDFDAIELIAVNRSRETQHRARSLSVEHDHRHGRGETFYRGTARPSESLASSWRDLGAKQSNSRFLLELSRGWFGIGRLRGRDARDRAQRYSKQPQTDGAGVAARRCLVHLATF